MSISKIRKIISYSAAFVFVISLFFLFKQIKSNKGIQRYAKEGMTAADRNGDVSEKDAASGTLKATGARVDRIAYIKEVSSLIREVDITIKNIEHNLLPIKDGVSNMDTYIHQMNSMEYPERLSRQHKMVLLSFEKLRKGLLIFSIERKDESVRLIKDGLRLLKYAANQIVDIARKEDMLRK